MIEQKKFSGVMNLDDSNDNLPSAHHKYALNVRFRGNGIDTRAENLPGTTSITNSLPSGTNQCVGSIYDKVKNRVYYFNYNSNGRNGIYYYDTVLGTITPLLVSYTNSPNDIFNFSPNYPIVSVDIMYKDPTEGDMLYWTDRNNRPMYLNINDALNNIYGSNWSSAYLTVARQMPLIAPICSYNDVVNGVNNLKSKLYQFRYRWIYKDNTKSTWSPWGKMFSPVNPDDIATDANVNKNNVINSIIKTGDSDVVKIEIAARQNLATTWANAVSVATLDKTALSISDNSIYTYSFYNDGSYEYIDEAESIQLYDYVPKKSNTQALLNGNLLVYGGITEGNTFNTPMNVSSQVTQIDNGTSTGLGLSITQTDSAYDSGNSHDAGRDAIIYTFLGGTTGLISASITVTEQTAAPGSAHTNTFTYTYTSGQTITDIINYFYTTINASTYFRCLKTSNVYNTVPDNSIMVYAIYDATAMTGSFSINSSSGGTTDVSISCYKQGSRYSFGICYFDEFGVTNGVNTTSSMGIVTLDASTTALGTNALKIPNIQFSINHAPPSWAKYFSFVRTNNLTIADFKTIVSGNAYKDGTSYGYLDITDYNTNTSGWPAYEFTKGDRIRILGVDGGAALSTVLDFPILDVVTKNPSGASGSGFWIKLQYTGYMSSWGSTGYQNYYVEVYTPTKNTDPTLQTYYEFGETYNIIKDVNVNSVHEGMNQSQVIGTGAQPAVYNFYRGDVYERLRLILAAQQYIMDQSVSDNYDSNVSGTGRPFVIDVYAKETYNSTLVRYGGSYQQGTNINNTNKFYAVNFEEYDKSKGDIQRFKLREKALRIFQSRATGVVNVYATEMYNQDGSSNLIGSTQILNPINYYLGEYGIGNQYCSLGSSGRADYFLDPVTGYHIRISQDGATALTELYKAQYFLPAIANKYLSTSYSMTNGGYAKVIGVYDMFEEEYISVFQSGTSGSDTLAAYTLGFNEKKNAYSSFYSYSPEWITSAQNNIISWKNGVLYVHNSATRNTFYGIQYSSSIIFVFNKDNVIKKTFDYVTLDSNDYWTSPTIGDVNTTLLQQSNLVQSDFEIHEGLYHAALQRDNSSLGGIINGDYLKGTWLETKFTNTATNFVYLSGLYLGYQLSNRNL